MTAQPSPARTFTATSPLARAFRFVALAEAVTFLVLLAAVVTYRVFDGPDLISALGPIHGIVFLVYLALVLKVKPEAGWSLGRTLIVILLAAVPFGGFFVGRDLEAPT